MAEFPGINTVLCLCLQTRPKLFPILRAELQTQRWDWSGEWQGRHLLLLTPPIPWHWGYRGFSMYNYHLGRGRVWKDKQRKRSQPREFQCRIAWIFIKNRLFLSKMKFSYFLLSTFFSAFSRNWGIQNSKESYVCFYVS